MGKSTVGLAFLSVALGLTVSCSGRNLHKGAPQGPHDRSTIVRGWTIPTQDLVGEAGVRGFEFSSPVLADQTLIFGSRGRGLTSLYPRLGLLRWNLPIKKGVGSPILEEQGAVYFVGGDGFLYCVQTETGRVNWRYDLRTWVASRPTLSGGRLFVTTADDVVYAFDAGTGKWLWHYRRRTSQSSAIHGASAPAVDKGEVLVGLSDGYLIALGVDDGSLKWERRLGLTQKFTDLDASPIVQGNEIYIPSYDGAFYTLRREGGEVLWKFDAGGARTVRLSADSIWLSSSNGTLYRLSRQSGKVLYEFELDKPAPTSVALTDDYVILGSTYQYLYVLDRESGEVVYRFNAGDGSGFASDPVLDPERRAFYILSQGGNLYQFFLRDLKHLQKVSPSAPLDPYGFQDRNFVRKSSRASSKASSESLSQSR